MDEHHRDLPERPRYPAAVLPANYFASVKCVQLAPGRAVHAVHAGPYANLHRTYAVLHTWCSQHALELTGESWEVYGDWTDDPSKLETGLFLRVKDA